MQIQTLAPSPLKNARSSDDTGMQRYVFVFPALFGLAGLGACKRRAWRNLALASAGICRSYGHDGLFAALQLSESRAAG